MFCAAAVGVEHLAKWPTAWGQLGSLVSYSCFLDSTGRQGGVLLSARHKYWHLYMQNFSNGSQLVAI